MSGPRGGRGNGRGIIRLARALLVLIPRADQRELIREDLDEELGRRDAAGSRSAAWYAGSVLESVADWWLATVSWRGAKRRLDHRTRPTGVRSGGLRADVRFALRMLRREKVVSGAVILTVVLGVSSTVAVATLLRGVLLRPLPYPEPDQIVRLSRTDDGVIAAFPVVGLPDLEDWRERSSTLTAVAGWTGGSATLTGLGRAERISLARVTLDFDRVLGIDAYAGRLFTADDFVPSGPGVVVLAYDFWVGRFGADRSIIGGVIELDGQSLTVIGVLPPTELDYPTELDAWVPLAPPANSWMRTTRGSSWLNAVARVRADTPIELAERELSAIQAVLIEEFPRTHEGQNGVRAEALRDVIVAPARPAIRMLAGTMGLVLLIASINVGLLLLARSNRRREELSVRAVLGGDRARLTRLLLTEALVLATLGGALGLPAALPLIDAMVMLYPGGLPRAAEVRLDAWVVVAAFLSILVAGGLASLAPAASLRRADLASGLRVREGGQGPGQTRVRNVLVGLQLALSVVLLIGAGLFARTLSNLRQTDPGFDVGRALTFQIAPAAATYATSAAVTEFYRTLIADLEALPGAEAAGGTSFLPFTRGEWGGGFQVANVTHEARVRQSWPGYYEALGLELERGRTFGWRDDADGTPVAMLNQTAARLAFGDENPLGRLLTFEGLDREIVGVLRDIRHRDLTERPGPEIHVPTAQLPRLEASVVVRTSLEPFALVPSVREVVGRLDPDIAVTGFGSMTDRIAASIAAERFRATLAAALAAMAAAIALIGVYGVMSYAVTQRRRELGIRFALGETSRSICARVLKAAGVLSLAGVAAGLGSAWIAARWLESLLHGVSARDPWIFGMVAIGIALAATASAFGPALRAARTDPLMTIRDV